MGKTPVLLNLLNTQATSYLKFSFRHSQYICLSLGLPPKNLKCQKLCLSSKLTTRPTLLVIGQFHYYQISIESLKKTMYDRMKDFMEKQSLLYSSQYGFRQALSTHHAILDVIETTQINMDKKKPLLMRSFYEQKKILLHCES